MSYLRCTRALQVVASVLAFLPILGSAQTWEPVGGGCSSSVYALEVFDEQLFAAGLFTQAGSVNVNYLARWNGSAWSSVGGLIVYMAADGLYANDTALFIGDAGRVRYWNGTQLTTIPGVFNSDLYSMTHYHDTLFVGGFFSSMGGNPFPHVARLNGNTYENLTTGCNAQATFLTVFHDSLFVGGNFSLAGDSVVNHTAVWDGVAWYPMGAGVDDDVFAHCMFHDTLYIGGRFTHANGQVASHVAKWNGTQWVQVGGPLNDFVAAMAVYHDQLYIGGAFTAPSHMARLQGTSWVAVGGGVDDDVKTMEVYHDSLFIGGHFTTAGGAPAGHIAKWYVDPAPVAAFTANDPSLCPSQCAVFADASSNNPITWAWTFPGGTPASSTFPSPTVCYSTPGVYAVGLTVTNAGGSSTTTQVDAITVELCAGVDDGSLKSTASIFPNPVLDRLMIRGDAAMRNARIDVFDLAGDRVLSAVARNGQVDVSMLNRGAYMLVLGQAHYRFIKQ
ncbi:MAG: PKD domain-containing protein [Flavobacteriales bacterium]